MKQFFQKTPSRILFTKAGYQKVLDKKTKLLNERPLAVENLHKSREMGDLSENGYYKASRARLSFLDAQLRKLEKQIRLGKVIENEVIGIIGFGSTVQLKSEKGIQTFTIVGGYESDPKEHTISHFSPLGKSLLGKKTGDTVVLHLSKGDMSYNILSIK